MGVWFAQKSGILSAADVFFDAPSGGNAKDVSAQSDNTIILSANSYTIAIDEIVTALRLSTADEDAGGAGVAGGGFTVAANGITINADLQAGTTDCLTTATGCTALTINTTTTATPGIRGGGTSSKHGLNNVAHANLTINGTSSGGSADSAYGIQNASACTIIVNGDSIGGSANFTYGINNTYGTVTLNGDSIGGTGIRASGICCYTVPALITGNLVNSLNASAVVGPIIHNPGVNNYIEYPKPTSGTYKYGKTIPAANVQSGVDGDGVDAPATGTLVAGGANSVIGSGVIKSAA